LQRFKLEGKVASGIPGGEVAIGMCWDVGVEMLVGVSVLLDPMECGLADPFLSLRPMKRWWGREVGGRGICMLELAA
jgi:hypothetical protein